MSDFENYKPRDFILRLHDGRELDLRQAMPMTLGDWEEMTKRNLATEKNFMASTPTQMIDFLHLLAQKIDPAFTREEIAKSPLKTLMSIGKVLLTFVSQDMPKDDEASKKNPPIDGNETSTG